LLAILSGMSRKKFVLNQGHSDETAVGRQDTRLKKRIVLIFFFFFLDISAVFVAELEVMEQPDYFFKQQPENNS
jgi:hypothetical protein